MAILDETLTKQAEAQPLQPVFSEMTPTELPIHSLFLVRDLCPHANISMASAVHKKLWLSPGSYHQVPELRTAPSEPV